MANMRTVKTATTAPVVATATGNTIIEAPFTGTVAAVNYIPTASIAGAASPSSRTLSIINHAQDGSGAVVVATLALVAGVNLVGFDEFAIPLSVVANATNVTVGDELSFLSVAVTSGTGLADPGGTIEVTFERGNG